MSARITKDDIDAIYEKVRRQMSAQADEAASRTHLEKSRKRASEQLGERVIGEGEEISREALNRLAWLERVFGDVAGLQSAGVPASKAEFWKAAKKYSTPVGARTFEDIMRRVGVPVSQNPINVADTSDPRLMFYLNPQMLAKLREEAKNRDVVERQMERGVFADKPLEHYLLLPAAGLGAALSGGRIGPMLALYETGRVASGDLSNEQKQQVENALHDAFGNLFTLAMASSLGVPLARVVARKAGSAAAKAAEAVARTPAAKRASEKLQKYGKLVEPAAEKGRALLEGAREAAKRAAKVGGSAKLAFDEFMSRYIIPTSLFGYGLSGGIDLSEEGLNRRYERRFGSSGKEERK